MNVRNAHRLPKTGPAIIVANHNSHLDTLVLMSLFPLKTLHSVRPVAAADYFMRNQYSKWFFLKIIGCISFQRTITKTNTAIFAGVFEALDRRSILILFPEGTRGDPEQLGEFKHGISRIVEARPEITVVPVFLHGLGRALPKNDWVLVPFFCDVFIGNALVWNHDRKKYIDQLNTVMLELAAKGNFPKWDV